MFNSHISQMGLECALQVVIKLQVLYHPEINKLPTIHRTLGEQLGMVLYSIVNETLKVMTARYNAMELIILEEVSSWQSLFLLTYLYLQHWSH